MSGASFIFLQDPMVWLEMCAVLLTLAYLVKLLVLGVSTERSTTSGFVLAVDSSKRKISVRCREEFERLLQFGTFVSINKESLSGQKV